MKNQMNRRDFVRHLGVSSAALPFLSGLPALAGKEGIAKKRFIVMFSPNGTVPSDFWPKTVGKDFEMGRILTPLQAYRERMLILKGLSNRVGGDGDRHMRGMSCLLTGTELFAGNIQGGSDTPAGWAKGISIDQEVKNFFQKNPETQTRFGSLEFGVAVPNRADPWTRMSYAGPNRPVAPISDPDVMMRKLYGNREARESLVSVVDVVQDDLKRVKNRLASQDRVLLDEHLALVRQLEQELEREKNSDELQHPVPDVDPDIELVNDNTPRISRVQMDILVNAMANDMTRVATLQFMRSVGQARMNWLGIEEGHHGLSHEPDKNTDAVEKLIKINEWFAGELAYLVKKLDSTPEPGGDGTMLDNTLIVWLNELGKGNSHTLDNIPFTLIGGEKATGFSMGRYQEMKAKTPHNRLLLSIANRMGHEIDAFGLPQFCEGGALDLG